MLKAVVPVLDDDAMGGALLLKVREHQVAQKHAWMMNLLEVWLNL
jgi:hypothetical protein